MSEVPVREDVDPLLAPPGAVGVADNIGHLVTDDGELIEDRHVVGSLETPGEGPDPDVTTLTDEEAIDFKNLMTVGRRTKTIIVADHAVVIQTLTVSDECRVGLYTKDFVDSQFFGRAHQIAVCASGVKAVDGKPLYQSLGPQEAEIVFHENIKILEQYYPIVLTKIYDAIMALEVEFGELAIKLGKL